MSLDFTPILQPVLTVCGLVITGVITIYTPRALDAFQKRTGITLTENQRQTFLGAVQTAKGNIETKLDQKVLSVAHVEITNPVIRKEAQAAINSVPTAAAALGMTVDGVARMIVGHVDTAAHDPDKPVVAVTTDTPIAVLPPTPAS